MLAFRHLNDTIYCVLVLVAAGIYLSPILLNKVSLTYFSRWLVCSLPPITIVTLSTLNKILYPEAITILNYLDVRFFLIGCLVIPLLVVQIHERKLLISTLSVSAFLLLFLDPFFNLINVGYAQLVDPDISKYFFSANFFSVVSYAFILFCLLYEKRLSDKAFRENEILISFLHKANDEIADQNSAIKLQSQELQAKQDQLVHANELIEKQKEHLLVIQSGLQSELVERNKELTIANDELIKYNHELQQFSYTISHNLRGPLARLLGLSNLMEKDLAHLTGAQLELVKLLAQSAHELDDVIRDLGKIIDIRNDIYRIREKVFFQEEWAAVLRSLTTFVKPDMKIESDFREAPVVYTVRPILTSVLYNLISNAIKYRSLDRPLVLKIKSFKKDDAIVLEVSDNGLGMDMDQFSRTIFGLYKRFHTHTEGKGLGLYLVKLQIESLGGRIEVSSKIDMGTSFKVFFKEPYGIEEQLVFECDDGSLFYNARTNCTGIIWKKQVTSEGYRLLFGKCIDIIRMYHTPFWLSDMRNQGEVKLDDQLWLLKEIFPEAVRQGLRKVFDVYNEEQHNEVYRERIKEKGKSLGVAVEFFKTREDADKAIVSTL